MNTKTILITGATGGIGKETAKGLAELGATVVVTGRDAGRAEEAVDDLRKSTGNDRIHFLLGDLSAQAGIQRLAGEVRERFERLDVLINNLGGLYATRRQTDDHLEATFAVNALTPFALTHALLDVLQANAPSRVVNVTGGMPTVTLELDNLQAEKGFRGLANYSLSKVAMMALSYELAQRLTGTGVTVNVVYPGAAATEMTRNMTSDMMPPLMRVIMPIMMPIMSLLARPENAARSSIRAASGPELEGVTGRYFDRRGRDAAWPASVLNEESRKRLWELAQGLVALPEPAAVSP